MDNDLFIMGFPEKCVLPMPENVNFFHYKGLRYLEIPAEEIIFYIRELCLFRKKRKRLLNELNLDKGMSERQNT